MASDYGDFFASEDDVDEVTAPAAASPQAADKDQSTAQEQRKAASSVAAGATSAKGGTGKSGTQQAPQAAAAGKSGSRKSRPHTGGKREAATGTAAAPAGRRPILFSRVVIIAIVALLLGVAIGYFACLAEVSNRINSLYAGLYGTSSSTAASSGSSSSVSFDANTAAGLPSGHPDINSLLNDDGSINQDALVAYHDQISGTGSSAGSTSASEDSTSGTASDSSNGGIADSAAANA